MLFRWLALPLLLASMHAHAGELIALAYHDIAMDARGDEYSVSQQAFTEQIEYLRGHGYTPISLKYLDKVRSGQAPLPEKALLLTFDDGLESYYRIAMPLLAHYGYPSVISIVTGWHDGRFVPDNYRGRLMTWRQLKEVSRSPLVEVVSHTDAMHQGILANPQGNKTPAARTREYDAKSASYESEAHFAVRIRADLARSRTRIREELAIDPVGVAWPHGQFDRLAEEEAKRQGLTYQLTLDNMPNRLDRLPRIDRITFRKYHGIADLQEALAYQEYRNRQLRFVEIDLAGFSGKSDVERETLLSSLLNRLALLRVNSVVIDPFTPRQEKAFFYNREMPVDSDILHRVLTQIVSRIRVTQIYLKIPSLIPGKDMPALYRDLARLNRFNGVIITDALSEVRQKALKTLFAYYEPGIQMGFTEKRDSMMEDDFYYMAVDTDRSDAEIARLLRQPGLDGARRLVVIRRQSATPDTRLVRVMAMLRDSAIRHYGYAPDDYTSNEPVALKIVSALHTHTIAEPGI